MHSIPPMAQPLSLQLYVPSVLSGVGTQRGPTFWKWKKCAAFRLLRRYELHFARAVAFSFCEQNGTPVDEMEKRGDLWSSPSLPPTRCVIVQHGRYYGQMVEGDSLHQNGGGGKHVICHKKRVCVGLGEAGMDP